MAFLHGMTRCPAGVEVFGTMVRFRVWGFGFRGFRAFRAFRAVPGLVVVLTWRFKVLGKP